MTCPVGFDASTCQPNTALVRIFHDVELQKESGFVRDESVKHESHHLDCTFMLRLKFYAVRQRCLFLRQARRWDSGAPRFLQAVNQSSGIKVTTPSGATYKSSVSNIVHSRIYPSIDRGKIEFTPKRMWHSGKLESGWATVFLDFPKPVTLDRIDIYSQHSGTSHAVVAAKVFTEDGKPELQCDETGLEPFASLSFDSVQSKKWKLDLKAGKKRMVVVRGLRFFNGAREMYPQLVPASAEQRLRPLDWSQVSTQSWLVTN